MRPAPMLRKSFRITKPVAKARVYSSGLAYDLLTLNGTATSDTVLDPGFTNYARRCSTRRTTSRRSCARART